MTERNLVVTAGTSRHKDPAKPHGYYEQPNITAGYSPVSTCLQPLLILYPEAHPPAVQSANSRATNTGEHMVLEMGFCQ